MHAYTCNMNMHASTHTNKHVHKHAGERQDYLAIETNNKNPNPEMSLFLGVFDGHGGTEAAKFAREHLWQFIHN